MKTGRLESLDLLRGTALLFIILFHASIYNFANIHKLDFSNPPLVVVVISFMALWGGTFIILSMVVNTLMVMRRTQVSSPTRIIGYLIVAGGLFLVAHFLLVGILGRWNVDFVNNQPELTMVPASLRSMGLRVVPTEVWLTGSSLSTIGANLILLSLLLFILIRNGQQRHEVRNYLLLGTAGTGIMLASVTRMSLFSLYSEAKATGSLLWGTLWSVALANPYPLLPYLAYGLFGMLIGMMLYNGREKLLKWVVTPVGALFLAYGLWGMMQHEKTISKPDYFWYFKTNAELGLFLLMVSLCVMVLERGPAQSRGAAVIKWFGRISLTIYMLETTVSELVRILGLAVVPSWNQTIEGCLIFGGVNVLLWVVIVSLWKKSNFKYSLEYFWVSFFAKIGKTSTKMTELPALQAHSMAQ